MGLGFSLDAGGAKRACDSGALAVLVVPSKRRRHAPVTAGGTLRLRSGQAASATVIGQGSHWRHSRASPILEQITGELLRPAAEEEGAVGSAKTEGIRHGIFHVNLAGLVGNVIQIALGVGIFEIDGGRQQLIAESEDGDASFQASSTAQ